MQRFELTISKTTRLFLGIILISVSTPGLLVLSANSENLEQKLFLPLLIGILIIGFVYYFAFGKLILKYSNGAISFEWKKRILFDNKNIESIKVHEIKTIIVDRGIFLRKIITTSRVIDINNGNPRNKDFQSFIENLIETVERNSGRVISSEQYRQEKGYNDSSFKLTMILLGFSIFLITRLWKLVEFYSLLLLLLPVGAYLRHVKLRVRKKTGGNKL